jgi:hypothetical protein
MKDKDHDGMDVIKFAVLSVKKLGIACEALDKIIKLEREHSCTLGDDRGDEIFEIAKAAMKEVDPQRLSPWAKKKTNED